MKRCSTFLLLTLLSFSLMACTSKTEETIPATKTVELKVMTLKNEYTIEDMEVSNSFNDIFKKVWAITETTDEVIYLEDAPYEIDQDIIVQDGKKQFAYSLFKHHSDSYLNDAENVMYVVLSKDGEMKGYLILDGTELHSKIEEFIKCI